MFPDAVPLGLARRCRPASSPKSPGEGANSPSDGSDLEVLLNPPGDEELLEGDQVIVLAEDDDT